MRFFLFVVTKKKYCKKVNCFEIVLSRGPGSNVTGPVRPVRDLSFHCTRGWDPTGLTFLWGLGIYLCLRQPSGARVAACVFLPAQLPIERSGQVLVAGLSSGGCLEREPPEGGRGWKGI